MKKEIDFSDLLIRYIENNVSDAERAMVDAWRNESPDHERDLMQMAHVVSDIQAAQMYLDVNTDQAWRKMKRSLGWNRIQWKRGVINCAAILSIPLLVTMIWQVLKINSFSEPDHVTAMVEMRTDVGMTGVVILPDSTKVHLNGGSRLVYPSDFMDNNRRVYLYGEAHFSVTPNPNKKFIVEIPNNDEICVYGTKFNVEAYPLSTPVISLAEGSIGYRYVDTHGINREYKMHPNQRLHKSNDRIIITDIDSKAACSWIDGKIYLDSTPLADICHMLSKKYGVHFVINIQNSDSIRISGGEVSVKSLEGIMKILVTATGIHWRYLATDSVDVEKTIEIY